MDGARLLDGLVTTEFSFMQELIWSPPHKNPFPLCSHSILSRLKNLSAEWRRASPTTRESSMSLIENLDADIKVFIELRKRCLKLLTCKDSTADASKNNVYLAKKVDSILVQHLEDSWNKPSFKITDTDIQKHESIDQDCLAADVLQLFVLDAPQKGQDRNKDEISEENFTVPGVDCQANKARGLGIEEHFSPPQGQSFPASDEHSAAISEQEPGVHILTTEAVKDGGSGAGRHSATGATNNTLQEMICTSNSDDNSSKGSGIEEELCVFTTKPDVTTASSECDAPKATPFTSIQVQSALVADEGPRLSMITPEAVNDAGRRGTIGTLECFLQTDEDSTATSEAKPNRSIQETEDDVEQAVTRLQDSSSCSAADEYFSAISDDEHDSMIEIRVTKNRDYSQIPEAAIVVNGAVSPMGANGSMISEVQHFPPGAGPVYPREIQIFSSNRETDGAQKFDEHYLREFPFGGTAGIIDMVKSKSAGNCSKEVLVEVEMTLRAKICEPEGEEPYWNVMFALFNYSNFKVSVEKLEYWSLDQQEDVKCINWCPGEMILREQPSFLCHNIKVPCSASNTSPRLGFSWQYSKLPEWIPTKDGKPKLEKGTIGKRFGNMLRFENAEKKLKQENLKSTKKRTA